MSILVIAISFLWSSLPANHHFHFPAKGKSEFVSTCIQEFAAYDKEIVSKKLTPLAVHASGDLIHRQDGLSITDFKPGVSTAARSVRYYLLFRVLRQ